MKKVSHSELKRGHTYYSPGTDMDLDYCFVFGFSVDYKDTIYIEFLNNFLNNYTCHTFSLSFREFYELDQDEVNELKAGAI